MRRRGLVAVGALVLLGGGACDGCTCGGAEGAGAVDAAAGRRGVTVTEVTGEVLARRGADWAPAVPGQTLGSGDALRTPELGQARFRLDPETEVRVWEDTEVSVESLSPGRGRLRLERGRLGAQVGADRRLEVESAGSSALARAGEGRFSVFNNGAGLVVVAAESAQVRLSTEGGDAVLAAGEAATVDGDAAHRRAIPESVLLSVAWPATDETRQTSLKLAGRTDAGARVTVNGTLADVDALGRFEAEVPLRTGDNPIRVDAVDLLGRRTSDRWRIRVFRDGPRIRVESEDLWK